MVERKLPSFPPGDVLTGISTRDLSIQHELHPSEKRAAERTTEKPAIIEICHREMQARFNPPKEFLDEEESLISALKAEGIDQKKSPWSKLEIGPVPSPILMGSMMRAVCLECRTLYTVHPMFVNGRFLAGNYGQCNRCLKKHRDEWLQSLRDKLKSIKEEKAECQRVRGAVDRLKQRLKVTDKQLRQVVG